MADTFDRLKTALADRYRIERELGAGGMATVYLAEDLKLHRKVALQVLRPELAAALGHGRFMLDIKLAANLTPPHTRPAHYHVPGFVDPEGFSTLPDTDSPVNHRPAGVHLDSARDEQEGRREKHESNR